MGYQSELNIPVDSIYVLGVKGSRDTSYAHVQMLSSKYSLGRVHGLEYAHLQFPLT